MKYIYQLYTWAKNLFSKKGRKENLFNTVEKRLKKVAVKKTLTRRDAKKKAIDKVKFFQSGPKKSNYELAQLCNRSGIKNILTIAGVKVNWPRMKFLN